MASIKSKIDVNPALIDPNPWNPNKQTPRVQEATRESIGRFGFIDPVTVRAHPDIEGRWQIIDGEHRWRAAVDLGLKKIAATVLDVSDSEAKKLTIVLNETRGEADTMDLAMLLAEIKVDDPNLLEALPYTQEQLDNLVGLADLDDWNDLGDGSKEPGAKADDGWTTVPVRVPALVASMFEQVVEMVQERGVSPHDDTAIANGQVLEVLCAEYVAGVQAEVVSS